MAAFDENRVILEGEAIPSKGVDGGCACLYRIFGKLTLGQGLGLRVLFLEVEGSRGQKGRG